LVDEIVSRLIGRQQVHGDHGKLERRATLKEQHLIVVGDAGKISARLLGFVNDAIEDLSPMAVLHNANAAAVGVPDRLLGLSEHRLGENGGARAEVVDSVGHGGLGARGLGARS
jgi:hypothetical protein